jgi:hypothetical protein
MAGIGGRSGPSGNQNAFRHGLAGISQRRVNGALNHTEQSIREKILAGLVADKGGEVQISRDHRQRRVWTPDPVSERHTMYALRLESSGS